MTRSRTVDLVSLAAIVSVALALRLFGLDWDHGHHLHPDERFLSIVLTQIQAPPDFATYFDPVTSPYNPFNHGIDFFVYGTLPLFLVDLLSSIFGMQGYDKTYLLGRALSAAMDTGTVVLVYLISRQLITGRSALLAALLAALAVHSIQLAHFFTVDTFSTFFSTAALLFLVRYADRRRWPDLIMLGIASGMAVACKLSAGLLFVMIAIWWIVQGWRGHQLRWGVGDATKWSAQGALVIAIAAITFRILQPYAFTSASPLDWQLGQPFLNAVAQQHAIQTGGYDWPPGVQWAGTAPYLFPLQQIVMWGVGPAFGIAAVAGIGVAIVTGWRRAHHPLVLPMAWAALNFAYSGALVLKTMRYFHPIYPVLALVVAWLFAEMWRQRDRMPHIPSPVIASTIIFGAGLTITATALWAASFAQIYTRDHPRIEASAWIHSNLPQGSRIATEHWDDRLPLGLPNLPHDRYEYVDIRVFDRDNPDKRQHLVKVLSSADALVLSSDRGSGAIPRMPQRYPLTIRYYETLWNGGLGFQLAAQFESRPTLALWTIDDSDAEEAFTVYDHPRVSVFIRDASDVAPLVTASLEQVDERGAVHVLPRVAVTAPIALAPKDAEMVRRGASWPNVYQERPLEGLPAAVLWYLIGLGLTLGLWPLIMRILAVLPDAGYAVTRALALPLAVLPAWWLASLKLVPFEPPAIIAGAGSLALFSSAVVWRRRRELWDALRPRVTSVFAVEGLFLVAYAGFLALRAANPDLWHPVFGGEKPMDYAHLNAVVRSTTFPPYDPWYAGGHLNYYYFGHVPTAAVSKVAGIPPATAYNLALASYAATAVAVVFAVAHSVWSLFRRPGWRAWAVGMLGVLLVVVAGNMHSIVQLVEISASHATDPISGWHVLAQIPNTIGGDLGRDYDFWAPTRIIPGTVNEFPWFTLTYGDLHPHLMNLGVTVVALLGALTLIVLGERRRRGPPPWTAWGAVLGLQALVLGLHRVTNPWDFPTYLLVTLVALAYALWRSGINRTRTILLLVTASAAGLAVASHVLFLPFHNHYVDFFSGVELTPETTPAFQWLLIFGLPTAIVLSLAIAICAEPLAKRPRSSIFDAHTAVVVALALLATSSLVLALIGGAETWSTRVLLAGLVTVVGMAAWQARHRPFMLVPLALFGAAILLTAVPEFVTVRDDVGRLNTVFKLHLQAWVLAGLAAAIALPQIARQLWQRPSWRALALPIGWTVAIGLLGATALIYPIAATPHKVGLRIQQLSPTLNGESFLDGGEISDQGTSINLTSDLDALTWLRNNVDGAPTIAEAPTTIYRWGGRVSAYTGLPAVVGWDWHARQQHWGYVHQVDARIDDMHELFATPDPTRARELLDRYEVGLIYIGELARSNYTGLAITKFDKMADLGVNPVYENDAVTIYRVTPVTINSPKGPVGRQPQEDRIQQHA